MKGRIVEAYYVWNDSPEKIQHGWFAINCEEFPEFIGGFITFYFENDDDFEKAHNDFSNDFKIVQDV